MALECKTKTQIQQIHNKYINHRDIKNIYNIYQIIKNVQTKQDITSVWVYNKTTVIRYITFQINTS